MSKINGITLKHSQDINHLSSVNITRINNEQRSCIHAEGFNETNFELCLRFLLLAYLTIPNSISMKKECLCCIKEEREREGEQQKEE